MDQTRVISDDEIDALLNGLDGVTNGPWRYYVPDAGYTDDYVVTDHPDHEPTSERRFSNLIAVTEGASTREQLTGQHIARCDPVTIRSLLVEIKSLRLGGGTTP